jgi:PAS domain S-box-containing protein
MESLKNISVESLIDSLYDGIYVCDTERKIIYWSKPAERITGWREEDVIGKHCFDDILCHIDKDGHKLCGSEFCPLHRSMITGKLSKVGQLVYALGANGQRIPMEVVVAPILDDAGKVIGGVETFREASAIVHDMERAKNIQQMAMKEDVPKDIGLVFTTHYIPHDIIGGDYYSIKDIGSGQYGLVLADVTGHGVAAALYTMHLSSLWNRYHTLIKNPVEFIGHVNNELAAVVKAEGSFATALCGLIDVNKRMFRFVSAGGPEPVLIHADGSYECLASEGFPLGLMANAEYEELSAEIHTGDCLLLFSDGAVEIKNAEGSLLDTEGLMRILQKQGYPKKPLQKEALEVELLKYSNSIRLDDDLTILEVRF